MLLDTSGLLAAIDAGQRAHPACARALRSARGTLWLSPFVLAELDYLLATRVSSAAQLALLAEVARGAYRLAAFDASDVAAAGAVIERYADQRIGLADASIVVLAGRHDERDVLTLDRRHFAALRRPNGRPFRILPAVG
jgi:predicted nucleic acid-binding protein